MARGPRVEGMKRVRRAEGREKRVKEGREGSSINVADYSQAFPAIEQC